MLCGDIRAPHKFVEYRVCAVLFCYRSYHFASYYLCFVVVVFDRPFCHVMILKYLYFCED